MKKERIRKPLMSVAKKTTANSRSPLTDSKKPSTPCTDFYRGVIRSYYNEHITDLISVPHTEAHGAKSGHRAGMSLDELERRHDYIQLLFPITTPGVNPHAPVLQSADAEAMRTTKPFLALHRVWVSFEMMMRFYGIEVKLQPVIARIPPPSGDTVNHETTSQPSGSVNEDDFQSCKSADFSDEPELDTSLSCDQKKYRRETPKERSSPRGDPFPMKATEKKQDDSRAQRDTAKMKASKLTPKAVDGEARHVVDDLTSETTHGLSSVMDWVSSRTSYPQPMDDNSEEEPLNSLVLMQVSLSPWSDGKFRKERYENLLRHPHNNLRITRILTFLGEMKWERLQLELATLLTHEVWGGALRLESCDYSLRNFWIPTLSVDDQLELKSRMKNWRKTKEERGEFWCTIRLPWSTYKKRAKRV